MRILVVGGGRGGQHLVATLCQEGHDVVVVDRDGDALAKMESQADVLTIRGNGSNPVVLDEAGLGRAEVLVALTNNDDANIVACQYARQLGTPNRVARITNPDYLRGKTAFSLSEAGVDLVVSKTGSVANELYNIITHPGTTEVADLCEGKVQVVGFRVHMDSPLIRAPLQEALGAERASRVRAIAALRGQELIIPRGDTQLLIGDDVYVTGQPGELRELIQWASPESASYAKIIIAGGGSLGLNLAQRLEAGGGPPVVLIEHDKKTALACSSVLERTLVLHGSALSEEMLQEVGIVPGTAFVASTGSDENNMISCLLAEKLGAKFTLAQINKPEYLSIINGQSLLDRAVSSYVAMSETVLNYLHRRRIKAATLLHGLPGEILDVSLSPAHPWVGKQVQQLAMPKGSMIAALVRQGEAMVPTGQLVLRSEDRMLLFAHHGAIAKLEALFRT
jgi:trk system potassium uptake protein TrkA